MIIKGFGNYYQLQSSESLAWMDFALPTTENPRFSIGDVGEGGYFTVDDMIEFRDALTLAIEALGK